MGLGKVIVTGACGFLGTRICLAFADAGHRIIGLDRVAKGGAGIADYRQVDLPSGAFGDVLAAEQPSLVIHAAGPASVAGSVAGPLADFEGSVRIHAHVLDAVRRNAPEARVITLSSAAVYGNPQSLPIAEDSILAPISPYGYHKVLCETLLKEYYTVYGVQSAALRIFSAYGAGLRRQLLWDVCEKATAGEVRLFGTGEETRDFIHADDVARACLAIAEGAPMHGEPYNVASGDETTVREVAERLVGEIAQGLPIHFTGEVRLGDPLRWQADISSVRALGFQPRVSLAEGVADYATWYESLRG